MPLALPVRNQSEGHEPGVDHRTPGYQHLTDKAGRGDGEALCAEQGGDSLNGAYDAKGYFLSNRDHRRSR